MAKDNPTGDNAAAVQIPLRTEQLDFLSRTFRAFKRQTEEDLEREGHLSDAKRRRCEQQIPVYQRLLEGIERGEIVPDPAIVDLAAQVAEVVDKSNGFQDVMMQHRATCRLLEAVEEGSGK
jgi:hypothetical protein